MNPAMDLVIELRDSLDNLVYTFLTTRTDLKTYTGTYSLNRTNYGGLGSYSIIAIGKDSVDSLQYDQLNVNIIDTTPPIGIISYP